MLAFGAASAAGKIANSIWGEKEFTNYNPTTTFLGDYKRAGSISGVQGGFEFDPNSFIDTKRTTFGKVMDIALPTLDTGMAIAGAGGFEKKAKAGIYIKPENRGKFTKYCGGKVTSECIQRGLKSKSAAVRKRANFARNARKWKKGENGLYVGKDPEFIFKDKYNTLLSKDEMTKFKKWALEESKRQGRDIMMDIGAYDVQGFWKSGEWKNKDKGGHGTDKFKKPNHPTFSNESMYSGTDGYEGGIWREDGGFIPSDFSKELYDMEYYNRLFGREPNRPEHLYFEYGQPEYAKGKPNMKRGGLLLDKPADTTNKPQSEFDGRLEATILSALPWGAKALMNNPAVPEILAGFYGLGKGIAPASLINLPGDMSPNQATYKKNKVALENIERAKSKVSPKRIDPDYPMNRIAIETANEFFGNPDNDLIIGPQSKFPKKMEDGGYVNSIKKINGPSHESGGVDKVLNGQPVEVEGGEYQFNFKDGSKAIFNKEQMQMYNSGVPISEIIKTMPKNNVIAKCGMRIKKKAQSGLYKGGLYYDEDNPYGVNLEIPTLGNYPGKEFNFGIKSNEISFPNVLDTPMGSELDYLKTDKIGSPETKAVNFFDQYRKNLKNSALAAGALGIGQVGQTVADMIRNKSERGPEPIPTIAPRMISPRYVSAEPGIRSTDRAFGTALEMSKITGRPEYIPQLLSQKFETTEKIVSDVNRVNVGENARVDAMNVQTGLRTDVANRQIMRNNEMDRIQFDMIKSQVRGGNIDNLYKTLAGIVNVGSQFGQNKLSADIMEYLKGSLAPIEFMQLMNKLGFSE